MCGRHELRRECIHRLNCCHFARPHEGACLTESDLKVYVHAGKPLDSIREGEGNEDVGAPRYIKELVCVVPGRDKDCEWNVWAENGSRRLDLELNEVGNVLVLCSLVMDKGTLHLVGHVAVTNVP